MDGELPTSDGEHVPCVFAPQPAEDDGKVVTCTVTLSSGLAATGALKMNLNCKYADEFKFREIATTIRF